MWTMAAKDSLETAVTKLRHLFSAAERRVLDSAVATSLADTGEKQLKALLGQARGLRDKWRDLVGAQTRQTKRGGKRVGPYPVAATVATNQRSRDKTDLFSAAVAQIEARLAELTGTAPGKVAKPTAAKVAKPAAKRVTKRAQAPVASPASLTSRAISRKARQAGTLEKLESAGVQGLKVSAASQRRAKAALKADRLKLKGITTRRAGHTQARGGRAQARRDGRNAGRK
jgi:hypothetical protein